MHGNYGAFPSGASDRSSCCTHHRLFRGRPVYPNSIFVDGSGLLFPQMDVWLRCFCVSRAKRSRAVRESNDDRAWGIGSAE